MVDRLTTAERICAASAVVLFVSSLFPWFTLDHDVNDVSWSGWDVSFPGGALPVILGLMVLMHIAFRRFAPDVRLPNLPWREIDLVCGVLAAVLVVREYLAGEVVSGFEFERAPAVAVAAVAGIALGVGSVLLAREQ